jgi:ABC-type uncharacterized transport system substrate-binding protein
MVSNSNVVTTILQSEVHTLPLVFVSVSDPIGSGFIADLARPGGNITGFANFQVLSCSESSAAASSKMDNNPRPTLNPAVPSRDTPIG